MKPSLLLSVVSALSAGVLTMGVAGAQPQSNPGQVPQVQVPRAMALPAPVVAASKSVQGVTVPASSITTQKVTLPTSSVTASSVAAPGALRLPQGAKSTGGVDEAHKAGNARLTAALLQIQAGTLSPDDAWQKGDLTYASICDFFEHSTGAWIVGERAKDGGLHHALIALLIAHEGEKLKALPQVPLAVRVWLADYYQSSGDGKCTEVAESILAQIPRPLNTTDDTSGMLPIAFQAIERMGWFYGQQKRFYEGAQAWEKLSQWIPIAGWWEYDAHVQAASMYVRSGHEDKASLIYDSLLKDPSEQLRQFSFQEHIYWLGISGKQQQMREMLKQPMAETDVDGAKLTEMSLIAYYHYDRGDFDEAQKLASEAVTLSHSFATPPKAPIVERRGGANEEIIDLSQHWRDLRFPAFAAPSEYSNFVHPGDKPLVVQVVIRSLKPIPLTAKCDSNLVAVKRLNDQPVDTGLCFTTTFELSMMPTNVKATLTITTPNDPSVSIQVPLLLKLQVPESQQTTDMVVVE